MNLLSLIGMIEADNLVGMLNIEAISVVNL
jgi:hypothetical protein